MQARLLSAIAASWIAFALPGMAVPQDHSITWDSRSLMIDGRRVFIWSGEFHPFRLPSPELWRDAFEKMKAVGYNTVTLYFPWDFYSFAPGKYDFSGIRDIDRVLSTAEKTGLYVIVRPGPYVNAELTRGGFPGWLVTQKAKARTDAPEYLAAVDEWMGHIDKIIARHQLTDGRGTVIAYQIENELPDTTPAHARYMQHLYDQARADGIAVPIYHNDIGRNGYWVPKASPVPLTVPGPADLYAWDSYPGGHCDADGSPGKPNAAPDFGWYGAGGARGGSSASPTTPGFTSEFGGGWFDYWGSNGSYECLAERLGSGYERVFYGTNIANGITIHSIYMGVGGTSWGWLPAPVVYTSYDYGAGIDETLGLRDKALTLKMLGEFIAAAAPSLAGMQRGEPIIASNSAIKLYHSTNPDDGTHLVVAMHAASNATTNERFTFALKTADGSYRVPQQGEIAINGLDAKMLLASFRFGGQHLVYATSQLQTVLSGSSGDVALFYAPQGETGEMVLRYTSEPSVEVLAGEVAHRFDAGDLRLDYRHGGLTRVRISGGGRAPLTLLLATTEIGKTFWHADDGTAAVLVRGGSLLRRVVWHDTALALNGDATTSEPIEVWTERPVKALRWNGEDIAITAAPDGSVKTVKSIPGPEPVQLPDLWSGGWRVMPGSPEAARDYDDSKWRSADAKGTASTTKPPQGQPVLTADDYGFYNGDVWYRGHFKGIAAARQLELTYGGGGAGLVQVWMDGRFLGQQELPAGAERPQTVGTVVFVLPPAARRAGYHVLSVMVRDDGHNWDVTADDIHKEGRGLITASLADGVGPRFAVPIAWKIMGLPAPVRDIERGPLNNGGLDGERKSFHLPGDFDRNWRFARPDASPPAPGTYWLRTHFELALPHESDIRLGLVFGDGTSLRSMRKYRVLIFVNGWNMGQYIAHVGPQRTFVLPEGVLDGHGPNTLALAVTTDGAPGDRPEPIHLAVLRNARGGPATREETSP